MSDPSERLHAVIKTVIERLAPSLSTHVYENVSHGDIDARWFASYAAGILRSRADHDIALAKQLDDAAAAVSP